MEPPAILKNMLCGYLGCEKVLWLRDGIDPDETNGHIDDVACFIAPGRGGVHLDRGPGEPLLSGGPATPSDMP
ncbi:MAG: agmatine deiminase family protein [Oscillospiraceae bacterium]